MHSLQLRLGVGLGISLVVLLGLLWLVVDFAIRALTEDFIASRLEHDAESLLAAIIFDSVGQPRIGPGDLDPIYHRAFSGHYFRVDGRDRVLRSQSLWDEDLPHAQVPAGRTAVAHVEGPQRRPLLVVSAGYRKRGQDLTISVAEDLSTLEEERREFRLAFAAMTGMVLLVLLLSQGLIVRRSLRPLGTAREDILRLERGEVEELTSEVPAEMQPLVREVNRLLSLLTRRLERSRNALGNLAHALKGPLTRVTELLDREELRARATLRSALLEQLKTIRERVERELKRARLAGSLVPGARFHPEQEVPPLVDALRTMYHARDLQIEYRMESGIDCFADRQDILELLGNLLDNACKWARHRVRLRIERAEGLSFFIEDDGPGVAEADRVRLAQRGVRVDESVSGHGLGLAIARDIVAEYGGNIGFDCSPELGGLRVRVALRPGEP
jgi:signal transduction histidine kinase